MKQSLVIAAIVIGICNAVLGQTTKISNYQKGLNALDSSNYQQAFLDFSWAITDNMTDKKKLAQIYVKRAQAQIGLHDYQNALYDCATAFSLNPHQYDAYVQKSDAEIHTGDYLKADSDAHLVINYLTNDKPDLANAYVELAKIEDADATYLSAIANCTIALNIDPTCRFAYWVRSNCYMGTHDYAKAISDCNGGMSYYKSKIDIAAIYCERANAEGCLGNYKKAVSDDSIAITYCPSGKAYWDRAVSYAHLQQLNPAIADYTSAIKLYDGDKITLATLYGKRGDAYKDAGNFQLATDDYTEAIQYNTGNKEALAQLYHSKGLCEENLGKYDLGIVEHTLSITMNPENYQAYWDRGDCYWNLNKYGDAIKDYIVVIDYCNKKDSSSLTTLYCKLGNCFYNLENYDKAIDAFTNAISYNTKNGLAYFDRATANTAILNYEPALKDFTMALPFYKSDRGNLSLVYYGRACVELQVKQYENAANDLSSAIALAPTYANAYYKRGRAYLQLNKNAEAMTDFRKALLLDTTTTQPDNITINRIFSFFYTGDSAKAVKIIQHHITNDKNNPKQLSADYYSMACLLSLMNKPDDAISYLKKATTLSVYKKCAIYDCDFDPIRNNPDFIALIK